MMPLVLADIGAVNTIKRVGGNPQVKQHLANLGLVVGGDVSIVNRLGGNIKDTRVAISEEMARKIFV